MPLRFQRPDAEPVVLAEHPALASWMAADHHEQRRLSDFLRAVEEDAEPALAKIAGDVALELTIGLPSAQSLTKHHDLDNYLFPVVGRLGQRRMPAVFARKVHADRSALALAPAQYVDHDTSALATIRVTGSPERPGWKEQLREALAEAAPPTPYAGAVALDVAFVVSSLRIWTSLWKPAIDAIAGPLVGVLDPDRPWSPNDDHITELGLHRTVDDSVGYDVVVHVWWHAVPDDH